MKDDGCGPNYTLETSDRVNNMGRYATRTLRDYHADVLPWHRYDRLRDALRLTNAARSRLRRIGLGPGASIYFENWDTIWFQLHEMLFLIDRHGTCVDDELRAFGALVPRGCELVATVAFASSSRPVRAAMVVDGA